MTAQSPPGFPSLPSDWRLERLDFLFDVQQGKQVSKQNRGGSNQRPFLRTKNVLWGTPDLENLDQMHFTEAEEARLELRPGDLLICEGGDIGRTAIWGGGIDRCYYQNHLHRARVRDPGIGNAEFGLYWLWYAFEVGGIYFGRGNVTTIPNLSKSKLAELPIPVPPIAEQRAIAAALGLVRRAAAEETQLLSLLTELRAALVATLLARGVLHEKTRETAIGPIPESWELVPFNKYVSIATGQVDPTHPPYREMLHVGPENIESGSGRLDRLRTNAELGITSGNYLFDQRDVLYSKIRPYLNKAALPDFAGTCSADMYPLRADPNDIDREFLLNVLLSPAFLRQAMAFQDRTGIPKINRAQLGSIKIPKPELKEQQQLAGIVRSCDAYIAAVHRRNDAVEEMFRSLLHELMGGRRRLAADSERSVGLSAGVGHT